MTEPLKRGEANHNPFDLEDDGTNWDGIDTPRADGKLLRFVSDAKGLRAGAVDLHTAWKRRGPRLEPIIERFAPPSENDTAAYIRAVEKELGAEPGAPLDLSTVAALGKLMKAVIRREQGRVIYSDLQIAEAARAALGQKETPAMPTQVAAAINPSHVAVGGGAGFMLQKPIIYLAAACHMPPMDDGTAYGFGALIVWMAVAWAARRGKKLPPLSNGGDAGGA
jgi:hypothetical protein